VGVGSLFRFLLAGESESQGKSRERMGARVKRGTGGGIDTRCSICQDVQPSHCSVVWLSVAVWKTKSVTACVENKCEEPWTNSSRHLLVVSTKVTWIG